MSNRGPSRVAVMSACALVACGDTSSDAPPDVCSAPAAATWVRRTQCGPTLDLTPINSYQGELAVMQAREDAVALINGSCTGTLIAASTGPVVLTAGHCGAVGDQVLVAFNVEEAPDGDQLVTQGTFIEQATEPDYALLRLEQLPAVTPTALGRTLSEALAIIQHPRGRPKVIAEGTLLASCDRLVYYVELDTLVGSSGAGVLNQAGALVGVHTDGDCDADGGGANRGWTSEAIVAASAYLRDEDLGDR